MGDQKNKMDQRIMAEVRRYYGDKVRQYGATPAGVDWNSEASQELRFAQLCKLLPTEGAVDVLDFGCGHGSLAAYLHDHFPGRSLRYTGHDLSPEMIKEGIRLHGDRKGVEFRASLGADDRFEHVIASGIFNVRGVAISTDDWEAYVHRTLDRLDEHSRKGFAFNVLTGYSDVERMRPDLYYADPCAVFDHCKRKYARNVALLHDYDLYEFTIIVRK